MIAVIKYNAGNTTSVVNALHRLNVESIVTSDLDVLASADKIIFPGVGHAASAKESLQRSGVWELIPALSQPILGICLGMQLMCEYTDEGGVMGLNIFNTKVLKFPAEDRVPHMGWNEVYTEENSTLLQNLHFKDFYFVHSYFAELCDSTSGRCQYMVEFSAVLEKENFYACQFHPEKSSEVGAQLLQNFLSL
ncbi:MAG: imidazole glycerol phosphate synthase subunit HisH [Flavobacteriales bacterium]|nr:imidazole glycerol phosphate synthase subunit HisH [Flavobacteriales bacterium]